jgi:hypothetical protein
MKIVRLILKGIDYIALFFIVCLFWYLLWIICMATIVPAITAIFLNLKQAPIKAAYVVKRYGLNLLPEFYAHLNPMPFDAAVQMEKDLAEDLRRAGHTVTGGH